MNIGIITISGGVNYGCSLQTYAVIKAYESLGHKALLLPDTTSRGIKLTHKKESTLSKLKPSYMLSVLKVRTKNKFFLKNQRDRLIPAIMKRKINAPVFAETKRARKDAFANFEEKYIPKANFTISNENLPLDKLEMFDFFSVGSDQVWNPTYPHTSEIRFLTFAKNSQKLSFAPSFGISELPDFVKKPYAEWLKEFPVLSVREQQGAHIIKALTGKDAEVICDPTITLPRKDWEAIEKKPFFFTDKPYALTYFLGNETNKYRRYIDNIAKEKGLQVVNLFDIREPRFYAADPSEFIYLIHHAEAVFTDSFHATVFSIIFKKDFVVFDRVEDGRSMGSRLKTLLEKFSLTDRMYDKISKGEFIGADFSCTDSIIEKERSKALSFLQKNIDINLKK